MTRFDNAHPDWIPTLNLRHNSGQKTGMGSYQCIYVGTARKEVAVEMYLQSTVNLLNVFLRWMKMKLTKKTRKHRQIWHHTTYTSLKVWSKSRLLETKLKQTLAEKELYLESCSSSQNWNLTECYTDLPNFVILFAFTFSVCWQSICKQAARHKLLQL